MVLGAHNLTYSRLGDGNAVQSTLPMTTSSSGSMLLACVGRGDLSVNVPTTDNKGNTFVQLGTTHEYNIWRGSGTSLYACAPAVGGSGHVVSAVKPPNDEVTLSVVEVRGGRYLQDLKWNEVPSGQPLTSASVTTTGPALLVAWWWGDASGAYDKTAVPNNGFSVIDAVLYEGWLVQGAVAVRQVSQAGTYNVTWAATPQQGAQLWIAAVQASA
ncbi:MAG: hypothetical protein JNL85_18560 [Rubrivivax sp.]|nr:hypothetical protein [Rubrivivax sp.]